jgi:hypothetical protein
MLLTCAACSTRGGPGSALATAVSTVSSPPTVVPLRSPTAFSGSAQPATPSGLAGTPTPRVIHTWDSPNGAWIAEVRLQSGADVDRLDFVVRNHEAGTRWLIESPNWEDLPGMGSPFPVVLGWSSSGSFMYFTHQRPGDGCLGPGNYGGRGLTRLNLATGASEILREGFASWMAISPGDVTAAYVQGWEGPIILQDLQTLSERVVPDPFVASREACPLESVVRNLVWSSDGESLLAAFVCAPCNDPYILTSLHRISVSSLASAQLLSLTDMGLVPLGWPANDQVLMRDPYGGNWVLDPRTGELLQQGS